MNLIGKSCKSIFTKRNDEKEIIEGTFLGFSKEDYPDDNIPYSYACVIILTDSGLVRIVPIQRDRYEFYFLGDMF